MHQLVCCVSLIPPIPKLPCQFKKKTDRIEPIVLVFLPGQSGDYAGADPQRQNGEESGGLKQPKNHPKEYREEGRKLRLLQIKLLKPNQEDAIVEHFALTMVDLSDPFSVF